MGRPDLAIVFQRANVSGGVERIALALLEDQLRRGREAVFVGRSIDPAGLPHAQVDLGLAPGALRPFAFRRAAAGALRKINARTVVSFGVDCPPGDVYWVHSVHAAWLANGGRVQFRGLPVPPSTRKALPRHRARLWLERDYFARGHPRLIMCTSQREADDLARLYGVSEDVMRVVPNGFDAGAFNLNRRRIDRDPVRAEIGARADDKVVLMVANEWHRKGLGVLLDAVARLADPRVRIDLVGKNPPTDYVRRATRLGLGDRFHWHGPSTDVGRYYAAADVFALPTVYEPFGLVIIEAMASGLPVIVSTLAGASAAITDGRSGFLVEDPRNPTEVAERLRVAFAAPADFVQAAAHAAAPYEWSSTFDRVDNLLFS